MITIQLLKNFIFHSRRKILKFTKLKKEFLYTTKKKKTLLLVMY